jgi:hypothetical protein
MKSLASVIALLFVLGCSSSATDSNGPNVVIHATPLDTSSNLFYFPGPVGLRYQITVENPLDQPVTLRRLDLRTIGSGAYFLRTGETSMNVTIPPKSAKQFSVSTWGRSRGGFLGSTEPVTLRGTAYFDSPGGAFVRLFNENIAPL